jgi:hypothetical protein
MPDLTIDTEAVQHALAIFDELGANGNREHAFAAAMEAYLSDANSRLPLLKVRRYTDEAGEERWTATDPNGETVGGSTEGYSDPRDRDHNAVKVLTGQYRIEFVD